MQEFKLKKVAGSKKKHSKKAAETQAATPLPDWEEGISPDLHLGHIYKGNVISLFVFKMAVFSSNIITTMQKGKEITDEMIQLNGCDIRPRSTL